MNIEAFNDFWLDCYTTMVYSILLSLGTVDKAYIYNNNYQYIFTEEKIPVTSQEFHSVRAATDNRIVEGKMFSTMQTKKLYEETDPIEAVKKMLDEQFVIFVGVDLFYWVKDNIHYNRNHIYHWSLVKSYDDVNQELIVLETGNNGYQEFSISYEDAKRAVCATKEESKIYSVNSDISGLMYTKAKLIENAKEIIRSINLVCEQRSNVFKVDDATNDIMDYMSDILQTHLFNMQNREKANRHLFMISFEPYDIKEYDYCTEFERLEKAFETLKNKCIKNKYKANDKKILDKIIDEMYGLLLDEKVIWENFIKRQEKMTLRKFD